MSDERNLLLRQAGASITYRSRLNAHRSQLPWRDPLRTNIRPQCLRNDHSSIRLLIILNDRDPGAPNGQRAAVQGVDELGLVLAFRPISNVRPPRLVRLEIRARRNLAVELLARQPHFDVVSLCR